MLHPSYSELMAVVNSEVEDGEQPIVQSRYSIVKATCQRRTKRNTTVYLRKGRQGKEQGSRPVRR